MEVGLDGWALAGHWLDRGLSSSLFLFLKEKQEK
jgi:hypothetical protein